MPRAASVFTPALRARVKIHRWGRVASAPGDAPVGTTPICALQRISTCASVVAPAASMAWTATLPTAACRNTRARWRPRSAVMSADISDTRSAVASFAMRGGSPRDWASIQLQKSSEARSSRTSSESAGSSARRDARPGTSTGSVPASIPWVISASTQS